MGNNTGPMLVNGECKLTGKKTHRHVPEIHSWKIPSLYKIES